MYFYIKYMCKDELEDVPGLILEPCEWVVEADNKEDAIKQLQAGEELIEIREISVEERIQREEKDLFQRIKWDYLYRRCANMPVREYSKIQKELENNLEIQYLALKEFNAKQRLIKRLSRQEGFNNMIMAEFDAKINQLIDAKDEEEFNNILKIARKK